MNNRWRNKGEEPTKASDYILFKDEEAEEEAPPTPDQLLMKMKAFGAGIRRPRSGNTR